MKNLIQKTLTLTLATTCALSVFAYEEDSMQKQSIYDVVNFRTSVDKSVKHNFWQAQVFIQHTNASLEKATSATNQALEKALNIIKQQKNVQIKDNNLRSRVHYNDKNQQDGWVVSGELTLRSGDNKALAETLTALNGLVAVQSLSSGVSKNKIASLDDEMIKNVLQQFENKADFIRKSMHAKSYKIVYLNINSPMADSYPQPYLMMRSSNATTAVLDEQKTTLKATVDAQIQLIK